MLFDDPALQQLKHSFDSQKVRKEGTVRATERGFGFLETADRTSYFIAPNYMKNLMHGDKISAIITEDERNRTSAEPETLLEPALTRFTGKLTINHAEGRTRYLVQPDSPVIKLQIICDDKRADKTHKLANGDWVVCNLTRHALRDHSFRGEITEFVTSGNDPKVPWTVSLRALDLPLECPAAPEAFVFHEGALSREDLTALPFVTIDSEKTKDMDDALFIEKNADGSFLLYVAIADPTGYIDENSPLDKEASKRAFSIYLPGRDIPMLPRELSDDLCSLREGEVRPVLCARIPVAADGTVEATKAVFTLANIKSHGKLIYNQVSDFLEKGIREPFNPSAEVESVLRLLTEFSKVRDHYRSTHSAPFRDRPDYEFVLNDAGALDHIEVNYRRIANRIVEECMITANIACGEVLSEHYQAGIFNTHKGFDLSVARDILDLLRKEGYNDATEESLGTLEGFGAVRRYASSQPTPYLDSRIRKLQEFSQISLKPAPHFALGLENYATWTSPIRKYGDMINHRLLKAMILNTQHPRLPDTDTLATMNQARRINRMAEREVREWLYVDYLEPDIAKKTVFTGEVFDVVRGGLRVSLSENGAFVFVPGSFITDDKAAIEFSSGSGEVLVNGKTVLRLGDPIKVRIAEVNKATRSIVAAPAEPVGGLKLPDPETVKQQRSAAQQRNGNNNQQRNGQHRNSNNNGNRRA